MKTSLTIITIFAVITLSAQDTPSNSYQRDIQQKGDIKGINNAPLKRDVAYIINNPDNRNDRIDEVNLKINRINQDVEHIIQSNHRLKAQNDSIRILQYQILQYAKQAEIRALRAEKAKKLYANEAKSWNYMIDLTTIVGACGAILIILGMNVYNTYQLNQINEKLKV